MDKVDKVLKRGVEMCLFPKLHHLREMLMVDVSIDTEKAHDGRRFVDSVGRRRRRFVVRVVVDWFRWEVPGAGLAI